MTTKQLGSVIIAIVVCHSAVLAGGITNNESRSVGGGRKDYDEIARHVGLASDEVPALLRLEQLLWEGFSEDIARSRTSAAVSRLTILAGELTGAGQAAPALTNAISEVALPRDLIDMLSSRNDRENGKSKLDQVGFMGLPRERIAEQRFLAVAVRRIARENPAFLLEIVAPRAGIAIPTAGDVIVYQSILDGLAENEDLAHTGSDSQPRRKLPHADALLSLATARNPVYRFLILSLLPVLATSGEEMSSALARFENEPDPTIQGASVEKLRHFAQKDRRGAERGNPPSGDSGHIEEK